MNHTFNLFIIEFLLFYCTFFRVFHDEYVTNFL